MGRSNKRDTIIFDAGGVLIYINEYRNSIIERVLISLGYDKELIKKAIAHVKLFDEEYFCQNDAICTWEDEKTWLEARAITIAEGIDSGNVELADRLKYLSFDTFQYKLYDETVEVLSRLKGEYTLSVLSNATASLDWAFDYLDIRHFFDEVIISSYEKCEKPDRKLYEIALRQLQKKAEQCIFIDDKIENVEMSIEIGMMGYHLDRKSGKTLFDFVKSLNKD